MIESVYMGSEGNYTIATIQLDVQDEVHPTAERGSEMGHGRMWIDEDINSSASELESAVRDKLFLP
jgi:hypothetical protein